MNENDFVVGVLTYITCLREKKRYSTAKSYQDALRSFKCFCGREEIPYAHISRYRVTSTSLGQQPRLITQKCIPINIRIRNLFPATKTFKRPQRILITLRRGITLFHGWT